MENYSIITTVYAKDKPEYLRQSIDSMLNQTILTDDYVIVKDGTLTSELDNIINEYHYQYSFFTIISLENNIGLGGALRTALKVCKNDLVARLDSDDISLPERCELQLKAFNTDPSLIIVGTDMYEFNNDPNDIITYKKMPETTEEIYDYGKRRNPFNHSSVMYRKSVIERYGSYSTMRRSQDIELFSKIIYGGCKCININKPLIKFRCGDIRVSRKKEWENVKSDIRIFYRSYKMGYSNMYDLFYILLIQIGFYILPYKLANLLYKKMFRKNTNL